LRSAASPWVDISSTCKVGQKIGVSLSLSLPLSLSLSLSVYMLPFGVTIPATVPQRSEIPDRLMNYPVLLLSLLTHLCGMYLYICISG